VARSDRIGEILSDAEAARIKGDFQKNKKLLDEAIAIYTRGGNYAAAAEVAEHLKDHARAARYWFRSGDFKRAAKEHLAAGEHQQAVELFERSGDYMKAAEVLETEGDLIRASMQYEKAGDPLRAADILWDALNTEGVTVTAPEAQEACNRAGKLYGELGRIDQAIQAYSRGGNIKRAAQLLEKAQRYDEAIELLSKAGDLLGAAEVARSAKMTDRASLLLALRAENAGRPWEAAAHYEQAGHHGQAAMLYEFGGDMARAAEAHERAGNLETAASIYQRIGEVQKAIRCLRAIGRHSEADRVSWDPDTSAVREIFDDGDYLQAARGFINAARNGRPHCYDEALHCLGLVEEGPSHVEAQRLTAEVLQEKGDNRGAIAVLRKLVDPLTPTEDHCPLLYQYGRLLESEGFFAEARGLYRNIVVLNPRFGDVTDRMRYIAERAEARPSVRTIVGTPAAAPPPSSVMAEQTPSGDVFDEDSTEEIDTDAILGEHRVRPTSGLDSGDIFAFATSRSLEGIVLRKRFRIERQLGGGGQARVFLARDTVLDRPVAIKVLHESVAASETGLDKFLREARLAARIHHPGCVAIFDFGHERGLTFIAMEFIEGRSLGDRLLEGKIDELRSLEIAREVADALGAAHAAEVIHRDVKPGNILIDESDRIRLTDFGVARVLDGDITGGLFTGTPKYMSPEQANGDLVDSRTDLYSLGAVLFEMLAGKAPFDGSLASVAVRLTQPPPDLPHDLGVSDRTRRIVRSCLQRDRVERPASCEALIGELDATIADITRRVMSRM
jgi:tetratricopeptide (TPR) repeat protein